MKMEARILLLANAIHLSNYGSRETGTMQEDSLIHLDTGNAGNYGVPYYFRFIVVYSLRVIRIRRAEQGSGVRFPRGRATVSGVSLASEPFSHVLTQDWMVLVGDKLQVRIPVRIGTG